MRTIVEERSKNIVVMDVFSKLIQERVIFIDDVIDDDLANGVVAQMLYLNSLDKTLPIDVYINSPGGCIISGMAIYDVSKVIESPIRTICVGMAASMAAVLMLMGKERCALKHSRIMLHEAATLMKGKTKDIEVDYILLKELQKEIFEVIKEKTTIKDIENTFKLDTWYKAKEAKEVGLIHTIL